MKAERNSPRRSLGCGPACETRRETHLHFGIDATGECRIAADLDLATANLEKIQGALGKRFRSAPRGEGAIVRTGNRRAIVVHRNVPRHEGSGIRISQVHFQNGRRTQPQQIAVAFRKNPFCLLVVSEHLFEC